MHAAATSRPRATPGPRAGRRTRAALVAVAGSALLAACTPTIGVPVAEHATEPICAEVILAMPDVVGGMEKTRTNAQATTAWGEPGAAVTARCGVEAPEPTAEAPCLSVPSDAGTVDWLAAPDDEGTWTFVTYGRDPAVEIKVPPTVTDDQSASFVADLNRAVQRVPQTSSCVGLGDVPTPDETGAATS
ncbi:DUF3515 family protein [Sediminihabitans luteus]|uniref:DUF3515 family protein n=1 Tax=Sediminihabitans luteus TaxID=1138585 RepID=UPI001EF248A2|nr:DUF3515 family protein [Sediminihabitans luteus]